jgi:hypothetical protein
VCKNLHPGFTMRTPQNCERSLSWAAANIWLVVGTAHDRNLETSHSSGGYCPLQELTDSTLQCKLHTGTKIQLYEYVHWMHAYLNFGYICEGHTGVWGLLLPVMDWRQYKLMLYVQGIVSVLCTSNPTLLFKERVTTAYGVQCCESTVQKTFLFIHL